MLDARQNWSHHEEASLSDSGHQTRPTQRSRNAFKSEVDRSHDRAVATIVTNTDKRVSDLRANLIVSLRLSAAGDRRSNEHRIPVKLSGSLKCGSVALQGTI